MVGGQITLVVRRHYRFLPLQNRRRNEGVSNPAIQRRGSGFLIVAPRLFSSLRPLPIGTQLGFLQPTCYRLDRRYRHLQHNNGRLVGGHFTFDFAAF